MTSARPREFFEKFDALRAELADLAFTLECRGRRDAADVTMEIAARVAELRDECMLQRSVTTIGLGSEHAERSPERLNSVLITPDNTL